MRGNFRLRTLLVRAGRRPCRAFRLKILLIAFALSAPSVAHAQQPKTLYEKDFYGDSTEMFVNRDPRTGCTLIPVPRECNVSLNGDDALPILVNPWEPVAINIHCAQVIFLPTGPLTPNSHIFAGNSFSPDKMAWTVPGPTGAASEKMCYPAGTALPFPARAVGATDNKPGQNNFALPHLDVHVQGGPKNVNYQVYLAVWYTLNPP